MSKLHKIELTDKELYIVWSIVTWFNSPVTSTFKQKLAGMAWSDKRKDFQKKYDRLIVDRIIGMGSWLKKRRETNGDV